MTYRIGEVAGAAGVSVEAIRYYERIGLLPKAPRTPSGIRRYAAETIDRIRFVKQAQSHGFTLAEVKDLIGPSQRPGMRRCRQVQRLLAAKIAEIDERRRQLDEFSRALRSHADACERSLREAPDPECPVIGRIGRS